MNTDSHTRNRIIIAALRCFFEQGIKKTNMDDIAAQAGVTRVTVYRHFKDKRALVKAAFLRIEEVFEQATHDASADPQPTLPGVLHRIERALSALPSGDLTTRLHELKRLYPDTYEAFQEFRLRVMGDLFDELFGMAEKQGLLREGVNRVFVQALYWEALVSLFENPRLRGLGISNTEMFSMFTDILLHGILKEGD